jgi:hypothetical protein
MKYKKFHIPLFPILTLAIILSLAGCAGNDSSGNTLPDQTMPTASPPLSVETTSPVAFFPVQKLGYEALAYPAALATGKLILENVYLRLKLEGYTSPVESPLIIWPPGSALQVQDNNIQVVREGRTIARVGETLNLGGGQVPQEIVSQYTGQALPADCPRPFWLAAPGVYNSPLPTVNNTGPFPNPTMTLTQEMKKNPDLIVATIYAEHFGISVDEALNRLQLQRNFSQVGLELKLESPEAETFAGLWWQHEPEFKIVVAFTRDGEETLKKYLNEEMTPFLPYLEVRTVQFSLVELQNIKVQLMSSLGQLEPPYDAGIDIANNCVYIGFSESIRATVEEIIRSGKLIVPEDVKVRYYGGKASPG